MPSSALPIENNLLASSQRKFSGLRYLSFYRPLTSKKHTLLRPTLRLRKSGAYKEHDTLGVKRFGVRA